MADSKMQDLTATTTLQDTDVAYVVVDPAGTPADRKITVANLRTSMQSGLDATYATDAALASHEADTTSIHGISDTSALVTTSTSLGGDLTGTVGNAQVASGAIVNADINASAAIALSKLASDPLARANHTGTQLASTVSDFSEAVDDRVAALLVAGSNVTLTYNDGANTLTVAASGGSPTVQTKTTTYTAVSGEIVLASAASAAWALTLPSATSGATVTVKKTDATANAITITPASGSIDGAATVQLTGFLESVYMVADGTNWWRI